MKIANYTLRGYFEQKSSPCLSFNVYKIGEQSGQHYAALHRSDYFQLIILQQGKIRQNIDQNSFEVGHNQLTLVFPHQINAFEIIDKETDGIIIQFDEMLFCSDLLKNELIAYNDDLMKKLNHVILPDGVFSKVNDYAVQILGLFREISPIKKEQIRFYIKIMLLEVIEAAHQHHNGFHSPDMADFFARFKALIETYFKTERTVSYYTDQLQMTSKKLNEICKNRTGQTPLSIIHERILTEIKRMLLFSGKNHKEIAYELGFDSPSALNKFVYAKLKETPTELKQELSQIYKF